MLETEAAKLAAFRRTEADLRNMTSALDARAKAGDDLADRIRHDQTFHHALVAAAHNPALIELYDYFSHAVNQTIEQTETGKIRLVVGATVSAEVTVYPGE